MQRRRIIVVLIAVVCVGMVVAVVWPREQEMEPEYNGKKLSEWMEVVIAVPNESEKGKEAIDALRNIGTNGLPFVLRWMCYEPSGARGWGFSALELCLPARIKNSDAFYNLKAGRAGRLQAGSMAFFRVVRERASPAIPTLVSIMTQTKPKSGSTEYAMFGLACVGEQSFPALLAVLEDHNRAGRIEAVQCLVKYAKVFRSVGAPAVPILISCLQEKDNDLAEWAARALGVFRLEPDLSVPALVVGLGNADSRVQVASTSALYRFGGDARSAVPALIRVANGASDRGVREAAQEALAGIAPEILRTNRVNHL